ncbi:MAG: OmpA family protein [Cyclobacteriaceae bacterium]|nr:OmpA family protein [Cyclobacteriaceae bacterium]
MIKNILFSLFIVFLISGCVTQKKYNELLAEKVRLEGDYSVSQDSLAESLEKYDELFSRHQTLVEDTVRLGNTIRELSRNLSDLQDEHSKLTTYYNNLLNNSGKLSRDMAEQQEHLLSLKENLEETKLLNEELARDLEERERKVKELEDILAKKDAAVNALRKKITDALLNFKESDLTVEVKNGKVYVSLAEQLLFKSGSKTVDPKGVGALKQLASAVKDQKGINIMVEGHTDNVPISRTSQYMQDNWDLSVMRATSIVRILTEAGVSPQQISASGKGEFSPLDTNESSEGRQKNRRTEIIITPDLGELFQILNSN